ncbi:MAG: sigma 54-interacting transcriptional regulator [Sandaracinaceae bacterium]|nr:sigma 54-interacting transcriptional regulator [Sandaracinaceae bacterium]
MGWSNDATLRSRKDDRGGSSPIPVVRILWTPEWIPDAPHLAALVEGRSLIIGRDESADIRLKDGMVSREHVSLIHLAGAVHLVDSSANGTFLDGERVEKGPVEDGSIVRVGDSFLVVRWQSPDQADADIPSLIGGAPAIQTLRSSIALMAPSDASVLVLGESGTGKELVAAALHEGSGRKGDLIAVNCAAIPKELAESQLFGHVAGAFTGAQKAHPGYFRSAEGGTLFLDEVGDLPADLQPKLLRALETRTVVPVGASAPIPVDIRLVAATHKNLEAGIDEGWFRGDLYSRISDLVLRTPPLRDRREDIVPLLIHALGDDRPMDPDLVAAMLEATWRFNVRELFKVGRELSVRATGAPRYELSMVESRLSRPGPEPVESAPSAPTSKASAPETPPPTREALIELLERHGGNVSHVAEAASRSRKQIYRYLEEHGIDPVVYRKKR